MFQIRLFLFLFIISVNAYSQDNSELILGTLRLHKEVDNRNLICKPIAGWDTENGTMRPDRTFYNDGTFKDYYTKDDIRFGKWEIKGNKLLITLIYSQSFIDSVEYLMPHLVANDMIVKVHKGNFYLKQSSQNIMYLRKRKIVLGDEMNFFVFKKIKN